MPIVEIDDLETRSTEGATGDIVLEIDGVDRGSPGFDLGDINDVLFTGVANNDTIYWDATAAKWKNRSTPGNGDVVGPASSGDGNLVLFNGTTGKVIKDGGVITAAGKALLDDASAADQRTTLGLGGAALLNVGAVAGTVCAGDDSRLSDSRTPTAHTLDGALHTVSGLTTGHFLKATGATTFGFAAHGLTYSDVGAVQAISSTANRLARFAGTNGQISDSSMREDSSGNVTITGNITVQGQSFQADHLIQTGSTFVLINNGETGVGVTSTRAGIEIDRGSLNPYRFQMHESTDDLRIGQYYVTLPYTGLTGVFQQFEKITGATSGAIGWVITDGDGAMALRGTAMAFANGETITGATSGATATAGTQIIVDSTQSVATRQDTPTSAGLAYWNAGLYRFDTTTGLTATATSLTVGATGTLDVSAGTLTLAAGQIGTSKLTADANLSMGTYGVSGDFFSLNTTPSVTPSVGMIYWDATEGVPSVMLSASTTMSIGTEIYVRCVNKTGAQINDGAVVYINGAQGNRPTIALARADAVLSSSVIGVATQNIADNAEGFVTISGDVHGYDTSGFADGDRLYLSATNAGQLTKTAPSSPHFVVVVATALNSTNNGTICVHPRSSIAGDTSLGSSNIVAPTQLAVKTYVDTQFSSGTNAAVILAPTSSTRNVIQPTNAAYVPLTIKGASAQSANLQEWQNSGGSVLASVASSGLLTASSATFTGPTFIHWGGGGSSLLAIQHNSGSDGNSWITCNTYNGGIRFWVDPTGFTTFLPTTITASAAGNIPLIVKGASAQTANLQEWQTSDGSIVGSISADGQTIAFGNAASGTTTITTKATDPGMSMLIQPATNSASGASGDLNLKSAASSYASYGPGNINIIVPDVSFTGARTNGEIYLKGCDNTTAGPTGGATSGGRIRLLAGYGMIGTTNTGGAGGEISITTGAGGVCTKAGSAAGAGGALTLTGGAGGVQSASTGGTGGAGATVTIMGGAGGNQTGASGTRTGGAGGAVTITGGTGGTGSTANGAYGIVSLVSGTKSISVDGTSGKASLLGNIFTDRFATASDTNTILGIDAAGTGSLAHTTGSTGWYNTIIGNIAGQAVSSGHSNTNIGYSAGRANTIGVANVCIGRLAGDQSADGSNHTLIGFEAGYNHRNGQMVALGYQAGRQAAYGSLAGMTAIGYQSLTAITTGSSNNTALGYQAGLSVSTGTNNLLLGYKAGDNLTTGSGNIIIGYDLDASAVGVSNELNIGGVIKGNITGVTTTAQIYAPDGAVGTPSYSFQSDTNTGLYWVSADKMAIVTGGTQRVIVDDSGNFGIGTSETWNPLIVNSRTVKTNTNLNYFASFQTSEALSANPHVLSFGIYGASANTDRACFIQTSEYGVGNVGFLSLQPNGGLVGIGTKTPAAKLAINGGLHVGGDSDPGDNNILADGDVTTMGAFYLGDPATNGTWKIVINGNDLDFSRRESGSYVRKGGFLA